MISIFFIYALICENYNPYSICNSNSEWMIQGSLKNPTPILNHSDEL